MLSGLYDGFRTRLTRYAFEVPYITLTLLYFFFIWIPFHFSEWLIVGAFLLAFIPFVLPVFLGVLTYFGWLDYVRVKKYWATEHCVLEIRLSEDITQSPYAAEMVIRGLYDTGEVDTPAHEFLGNTRPWYSLELVSTEGVVRFYLWTRARYKERIKAQIYAHYPTVQVVEVPDYTLHVPWHPDNYDLWGVEQQLQLPDPYPIATYVEQGLNKPDMKEEFKTDPLVSFIEYFGSIGPGENLWSQIVIRGHTEVPSPGFHHHEMKLNEYANEVINKLGNTYVDRTPDGKTVPNFNRLPDKDKEAIKAIGQKLNKPIFDVGIRTIYIARKDAFKGGIRNSGIPTAFRSFEHGSQGIGLNGFKPYFYIGPLNVKWHDFLGLRRAGLKKKFYEGYVTRQFFYPPNKDPYIALNTEEIASIWHLPGKVAHTPTLERMPSRRAEAPANLPI